MIYRAPDYPKAFDWEFYKDREAVDHWNQPGYHHERLEAALQLMMTTIKICGLSPKSVADFACGAGGLLGQIKKIASPKVKLWGYDISPLALAYAREIYGVDAHLADITQQGLIPIVYVQPLIEYPEWLILTETLEHLLNPVELLVRARQEGVRYVLASVPAYEDAACSEHHNWAWTDDSFGTMFEFCGYKLLTQEVAFNTQYVIGAAS